MASPCMAACAAQPHHALFALCPKTAPSPRAGAGGGRPCKSTIAPAATPAMPHHRSRWLHVVKCTSPKHNYSKCTCQGICALHTQCRRALHGVRRVPRHASTRHLLATHTQQRQRSDGACSACKHWVDTVCLSGYGCSCVLAWGSSIPAAELRGHWGELRTLRCIPLCLRPSKVNAKFLSDRCSTASAAERSGASGRHLAPAHQAAEHCARVSLSLSPQRGRGRLQRPRRPRVGSGAARRLSVSPGPLRRSRCA